MPCSVVGGIFRFAHRALRHGRQATGVRVCRYVDGAVQTRFVVDLEVWELIEQARGEVVSQVV